MSLTERTGKLTIRIAPAELQMLQALAANDGITVSAWIRLTARREHAKLAPLPKRRKSASAKGRSIIPAAPSTSDRLTEKKAEWTA